MMSMKSKRELLGVLQPRYLKANKVEKQKMVDENITFSRPRPYQKNDQAHVEQKNWSMVQHTVGYDRWETDQEFAMMENIYADLRLYINFFQSSFKLIAKERIGSKTLKRYGSSQDTFQRILEHKDISLEAKARLMNLFVQLNPAEPRRAIDSKNRQTLEYFSVTFLLDATLPPK